MPLTTDLRIIAKTAEPAIVPTMSELMVEAADAIDHATELLLAALPLMRTSDGAVQEDIRVFLRTHSQKL